MNHHVSLLARKAYALLSLKRRIVGVQFACSAEDYEKLPAKGVKAAIAYCVAVKAAMSGRPIKLSRDYSGCRGGSRALGFEIPVPEFITGELYHGFGLYKDQTISKQVATRMIFCQKPCYGVMIQPLEHYQNDPPDVVILTVDSLNAMRMVQGYTWAYGSGTAFRMTGNQALCVECTSLPFESDQMNMSMLCSGTRYLAGWQSNDIAIGLPYQRFSETVTGLLQTANAVETDSAKHRIQQHLINAGCEDPGFDLGRTYYTDLERRKHQQRKKLP